MFPGVILQCCSNKTHKLFLVASTILHCTKLVTLAPVALYERISKAVLLLSAWDPAQAFTYH